jgi:hypothetical protein
MIVSARRRMSEMNAARVGCVRLATALRPMMPDVRRYRPAGSEALLKTPAQPAETITEL